jgi:hypothetical protein
MGLFGNRPAIRANAAVLRRMGRNASYAKGHRETSVEGKIDPFGVDLDRMRAEIAVRLAGGPGPGDDDLPLNDADKKWLTDMVDARVNLQIRQLLAPNQEGYNRIIQASNDSIEQKGATLTRYAKDGSLQAK